MTRLFIDGQEVALPASLDLDFITENPYFTRNGKYTYDLDIDLTHPANRQIYNHINRFDVTEKMSNRKAELWADGVVIISGIEIILSVDYRNVKIQIVAGNSQLNYDGTKKIREIEFDIESASPETAVETLYGNYPDFNAVYTPVIYHNYNRESPRNKVATNGTTVIMEAEELIPQYYLLYLVDNLLKKMGFKQGRNQLQGNPVWSRVFVVNSQVGLKPQDILPDWTVNEFIEQIELYLNCIIKIDESSGTYDIMDISNYFTEDRVAYISECIDDSLEKTYDTDTNYAFAYKYVSYDFPGDSYYNYLRLKEGVREVCTVVPADRFQDFDKGRFEEFYSHPFILHTTDNNLDYVVTRYKTGNLDGVPGLTVVDQFKNVGDATSQNITAFKIVPAEVEFITVWDYKSGLRVIAAAVKQIVKTEESTQNKGINDLINGGELKPDIPDRIYIGIYYGLCKGGFETSDLYPNPPGNRVPISAIDCYNITYPDGYNKNQLMLEMPGYTLALDGETGLFESVYKNKREIDTSVEYRFRFRVQEIYDLNQVFCIRNKRYYCKEIRYKINQYGIDKIAEGVFYLAEA